ncbi:arginase family protein [Rheinheimera texasensis]|uniref:arginase family protein n=1 Tax=Rheinheimera texasensis TaxID=306205 RepID=UPI0032B2C34F
MSYCADSLWVLSKAVEFNANPNGRFAVQHRLNGRRFELDQLSADYARLYSQQIRFAAGQQLSNLNAETVTTIHQYLVNTGILLPADADVETRQLLSFQAPTTPLFGATRCVNFTQHQAGQLCLYGAPFAASFPATLGCRQASHSLRQYAQKIGINLHKAAVRQLANLCQVPPDYSFNTLQNRVNAELLDCGDLHISPFESAALAQRKIALTWRSCLAQGLVPVMLGGDHSVTYPALQEVAAQHPAFYVLQLDAHSDTYWSGTDEIYGDVVPPHHANFMALALRDFPQIRQVVQVGLRGLANFNLPASPRQHVIWANDLQTSPAVFPDPTLPVYITLDLDVLDPVWLPGTGEALPGGLSLTQLALLLREICSHRRVIGMDMVELNPALDDSGRSVKTALEALLLLMNSGE